MLALLLGPLQRFLDAGRGHVVGSWTGDPELPLELARLRSLLYQHVRLGHHDITVTIGAYEAIFGAHGSHYSVFGRRADSVVFTLNDCCVMLFLEAAHVSD